MLATTAQQHDLPLQLDVVTAKSGGKFAVCTELPRLSTAREDAVPCQIALRALREVTTNAILDLRGVGLRMDNIGGELVALAAKGGSVTFVTESGELPNCLQMAKINHRGNVKCVQSLDAAMALNGITSPFSEPVDISRISRKYEELREASKPSLSTLSAPSLTRASQTSDVNCLTSQTKDGIALKLLSKSGRLENGEDLPVKLKDLLERNREPGKNLVLDLSEISGISDVALGVLISVGNELKRAGLKLTISEASAAVVEKLRIRKLETTFGMKLKAAA